jgi:nucleoid DNA-binding protein
MVEAVAEQNGYPKSRSFQIIENLLEMIKGALESGEDVMISGFGMLTVIGSITFGILNAIFNRMHQKIFM